MSSCDHCHSRKGKRACPFLHGHICSVCCGENRGVKFDCPRDCPWFEPAAAAPSAGSSAAVPGRVGSAGPGGSPAPGAAAASHATTQAVPSGPLPDLSRYQKFLGSGRRLHADLMGRLEFLIARYDQGHRGLADLDALHALEYLRRRASPILAVERFAPHMGQYLEKAVTEMLRGGPAPGPYDLVEILDHLIEVVRNFGPPGSRYYLEQVALLERHSRTAGQDAPETEDPAGRAQAGATGGAPPTGSRIIRPR
jgi:hypothetical protein